MKKTTFLMLLMLFFASYISTQAQKIDDDFLKKHTYYTLKEALESPAEVYVLDFRTADYWGNRSDVVFNEEYAGIVEIVPPNIGNFVNLRKLYLSKNKQIKNLPAEITKLVNLEVLSLSCMGTDFDFDDAFKKISILPKLTRLSINENGFKEIPVQVLKMTNLTYLELNNNALTSIPSGIKKLNLKAIWVTF